MRAGQCGVIGHDGHDHLAVRGCFFWRLGHGSACDGLRFFPGAIINGQLVEKTLTNANYSETPDDIPARTLHIDLAQQE
jgi:hypothetical protein